MEHRCGCLAARDEDGRDYCNVREASAAVVVVRGGGRERLAVEASGPSDTEARGLKVHAVFRAQTLNASLKLHTV